jgi:hypothetical protein
LTTNLPTALDRDGTCGSCAETSGELGGSAK